MREMEARLDLKCPFCRHPRPATMKEFEKNLIRRIEANDPVAIWKMGSIRYEKGDYKSAFQHFTKAAELGNVDAGYNLSCLYKEGQGVEKDEEKELHHLEEAAIGGHTYARNNLGVLEMKEGRMDSIEQ
jgi:TPR repeat protein